VCVLRRSIDRSLLALCLCQEAGDFGNAVYLSLRHRCSESGTLSIGQLNDYLDQLNQATERAMRVKILQRLLRCTTAIQQKWLVRIILKQLKTGLYVWRSGACGTVLCIIPPPPSPSDIIPPPLAIDLKRPFLIPFIPTLWSCSRFHPTFVRSVKT
jgi:hypothetical protein